MNILNLIVLFYSRFPLLIRNARGVPKFLGQMARGCNIFRDSIFPVTPINAIISRKEHKSDACNRNVHIS